VETILSENDQMESVLEMHLNKVSKSNK